MKKEFWISQQEIQKTSLKVAAQSNHKQPLAFWIAEMDLLPPRSLLQRIFKQIQRNGLGYPGVQHDIIQIIIQRFKRTTDIDLKGTQILICGGVMTHFACFLNANLNKGEGVVVFTPCYHGSINVIKLNGFRPIECRLKIKNDSMEIDVDQLRQISISQRPKAVFLINPHNPCGFVWSRDVLASIVSICKENGMTLVVDQIMSEFYLESEPASILEWRNQYSNILLLDSPSKIFNIQQLRTAYGIYMNLQQLRLTRRYMQALKINHQSRQSLIAFDFVYNSSQAQDYVQSVKQQLKLNYRLLKQLVQLEMPKAVLFRLEASYLVVIDFSAYFSSSQAFQRQLSRQGLKLLNLQIMQVVPRKRVWARISIACQPKALHQLIQRLKPIKASL